MASGGEALDSEVLWAAAPTPKATEAAYSFSLPPTECVVTTPSPACLNADATVFVPAVQSGRDGPVTVLQKKKPETRREEHARSEHLEAQIDGEDCVRASEICCKSGGPLSC